MSGRCEECGAKTVWDQDIGSAICLQCGTLADPTQSVLTSHLEQADTSGRDFTPWMNATGAGTLKGRNGWSLAGQGKEGRDRKNTIAMHEFIRTLALRLSNAGVTTRAQGIFDQAMRVGQYRWGRKAKLTAGAALAIALRDFHKSDSISDIAYLLDEPPTTVSRAFRKVASLLQLKVEVADPASHVSVLQTHLMSLLKGSEEGSSAEASSPFPAQLSKVLLPLIPRLPNVMHIASSLSALIARTNLFAHLPTPPTGCALFMLALEGELSTSLPNGTILAQALGSRLGVGKRAVMERYKQVYDLIEDWIREVPWLDAHERKTTKGKAGAGRSKVAKRVVVARGLKDVVQFQEEIWRKRMENGGRPHLQLDIDEQDGDGSSDEWDSTAPSGGTSRTRSVQGSSTTEDDPTSTRKPSKGLNKPVADASHFLLNPLSTFTPSSSSSRARPNAGPDLLTHLLTADASALPHAFTHPPTRLQLLATARGGGSAAHIHDDELFADGELEGYMRDAAEAETVRIALGWDIESANADADEGTVQVSRADKGKKRKRGAGQRDAEGEEGPVRGSKRINMDVLARLLDSDADVTAVVEDMGEEPADDNGSPGDYTEEGDEAAFQDWEEDAEDIAEETAGTGVLGNTASLHHGDAAEEEVVEEWRPMSPGGGGCSTEDWYEF